MPTTSFEIQLADSDDEHLILSVIRVPQLHPD